MIRSTRAVATSAHANGAVAPGLRPEVEWLLAVASVDSPPDRALRLRALCALGLDTARLLALIERHRLQAHVARTLETLPPGVAPSGLARSLCAAARSESVHNLQLSQELLALIALLESEQIPVLAYKGPVLAEVLYGGVAARHAWDLDLFIRHGDLERVRGHLQARGYVPEAPPQSQVEREMLARECDSNLDHPRLGIHLELHWELFDEANRRGLEAEFMWRHVTRVEIGGGSVLAPAPEEMFVVLCAHAGEKHRWGRLKWILDVARFPIAYPNLYWPEVLALAAGVGRRQVVLEGIFLAVHLLGASFPRAIFAEAESDERVAEHAALARGRLFRDDADFPGFAEWRAYLEAQQTRSAHIRVAGSARSLAHYLRTVFTPDWADRRRHRIPESLDFLHYILRVSQLAHVYRAGFAARLK